MKKLSLPCLRGVIGDWTYFSSVMKIKDVVENNRIKTVAETQDLYTKSINKILQREIKSKRIGQIRNYLTCNKERFFSSLIVAIHKGNPQWADFDIEHYFRIDNQIVEEENLNFIENKLGVLTLSGDEEIFALDGQHRLMGIRSALKENENLGDEEISLLFVVHNDKLKERTRRLFTVLNKYAEKPKEAELIILDEDDSAAILTRRLVENHPVFKMENTVSDSNSPSLSINDTVHFTTLVMINRINKEILGKCSVDYTQRPDDVKLEEYYTKIVNFWDLFFELFPEIIEFIEGKKVYLNGSLFNRNEESGGSLLLRPVGQLLFAKLYMNFLLADEIEEFKQKIRKVDFNLSGPVWQYIYWHGKMLPKEEALKKNLLFYLMGRYKNEEIHREIKRIYDSRGVNYTNRIQPVI